MKWYLLISYFLCSIICNAQVTYYEHIAPIIKKNCQSCHQDGDIGPIPLNTYDDVASYASMIKFVIDIKLMPPFKADHHKVKYANERFISDKEKKLLEKWIDEGLPAGSRTEFGSTLQDNSLSFYDYTVCMSEPFEHYGIYYDQYQVFPLELDIPTDKYITDVVFEPGNKEIVRSANISIAPIGSSSKMDTWDPRYGFYAYGSIGFTASFPNWMSWMPHTSSNELSESEHLYLPSNSELLLHIHYGPSGEVQTDSSCVHLSFADHPSPILQNVPLAHTGLLADTFLLEKELKKRISSSLELPIDVNLRSITPLAHLLCRSWEVFAVLPDQSSISILSINDWDFHWREKYIFKESLHLPKGTKIYTTATYDNTSTNPYNPSDPPHTMKAGPHMYDENFVCYFEIGAIQSDAMISKPLTVTEDVLRDLTFTIAKEGHYNIESYDLSSNNVKTIANKTFSIGKHTVQSSDLPSTKGVHVICIQDGTKLMDSWWIVVL